MNLEGLLKTKKLKLDSFGGVEVELTELSHGARRLVGQSALDEDGMEGSLICKYALGLDESAEEVGFKLSQDQVEEVCAAASELMGLPESEEEAVKN